MDIREYATRNGKIPFSDWLNELRDRRIRARIRIRLDRVQLGILGDYKSVGGGVYEMRINYGPGYRIYFGFVDKIVILLLAGGDKRNQKVDIKKAIAYWVDYKGCKDD